jgi:hypothetical protein
VPVELHVYPGAFHGSHERDQLAALKAAFARD